MVGFKKNIILVQHFNLNSMKLLSLKNNAAGLHVRFVSLLITKTYDLGIFRIR